MVIPNSLEVTAASEQRTKIFREISPAKPVKPAEGALVLATDPNASSGQTLSLRRVNSPSFPRLEHHPQSAITGLHSRDHLPHDTN